MGGTGIPFDLYRRLKRTPQAVGIYKFGRHFAWQGARLVGLTPCGRATADVLNINEPHRIELRELLILGGVFPPEDE